MKTAAIAFVAIGLAITAGSTAASAASRATDVDYIRASRCKGLATGLASGDVASFEAYLKAEGVTRNDTVLEMASDAFKRAKREASAQDGRERLTSELNGACTAYNGGKSVAATAAGHATP